MSFKNYQDNEFDNDHRTFSGPVLVTIGIVSAMVLVILLVVLAMNNTTSGKNNRKNNEMMNLSTPERSKTAMEIAQSYSDGNGEKDIEALYESHQLTADDLDIWDMYDRHSVTPSETPESTSEPTNSEVPEPAGSPFAEEEGETDNSSSPLPSETPNDGLIEGVKENNLDFTNVKIVGGLLHYTINGNEAAHRGVMVSEANGVVDFATLKNSGIDFAIIRVGSRGYESGVINLDKNFENNIKGASEAGLDIGLYFSSRAVSATEAYEEADYCISVSGEFSVKYPICYYFEGKVFEEARTDFLEKDDLTQIADSFLKRVQECGKIPMIYGTDSFLLEDVNPEKLLIKYDVLLNDQNSMPKYPYQYKMWKYMSNTIIPGMEYPGDYVASFVDYSGR